MVCYPNVVQCLSACMCLLLKAFHLQCLEGFFFACSLSLTSSGAAVAAPWPGVSMFFSSRPCTDAFTRSYSLRKGLLSYASVLLSSTCSSCCCLVIVCSLHWGSPTMSTWCLLDRWLGIRTNMTNNGWIIVILRYDEYYLITDVCKA